MSDYPDCKGQWELGCKRSDAMEKRIAALTAEVEGLREAGLLALKVAEDWIHDQLDGTGSLGNAFAELDPARALLKRSTP